MEYVDAVVLIEINQTWSPSRSLSYCTLLALIIICVPFICESRTDVASLHRLLESLHALGESLAMRMSSYYLYLIPCFIRFDNI